MFDIDDDFNINTSTDYLDWDTLDDHPVAIPIDYLSRIINYSEQVFWETGLLPTVEKIEESLGILKSVIAATIKSEKYITQLASRGIDFSPTTSSKVLSPKQLVVCNLMLNLHDKRSEREKLELVGVSSQQYHAWLRSPIFQEYLRKRGEALFQSSDHDAYKALIRNVKSGDNQAIKLFMEIRGIYNPKLTVDINIQSVLLSVVEVISKHVTDPTILTAIADDLEGIIDVPSNQKELGR